MCENNNNNNIKNFPDSETIINGWRLMGFSVLRTNLIKKDGWVFGLLLLFHSCQSGMWREERRKVTIEWDKYNYYIYMGRGGGNLINEIN